MKANLIEGISFYFLWVESVKINFRNLVVLIILVILTYFNRAIMFKKSYYFNIDE